MGSNVTFQTVGTWIFYIVISVCAIGLACFFVYFGIKCMWEKFCTSTERINRNRNAVTEIEDSLMLPSEEYTLTNISNII